MKEAVLHISISVFVSVICASVALMLHNKCVCLFCCEGVGITRISIHLCLQGVYNIQLQKQRGQLVQVVVCEEG